MATGNAEKVAWAYAFLASFIFIEIGAFNANDPYVGGMSVPASIPSGHEFCVGSGRPGSWVSPQGRGGNTSSAGILQFSESCVVRIGEGSLVPLCLNPSDRPCRDEPSCC